MVLDGVIGPGLGLFLPFEFSADLDPLVAELIVEFQ